MARRSRGFTLVEILVVLGIIAVLLTILLPAVASVRKAARSTACLAQLQGWGQAYAMYLGAHGVNAIPLQDGDDERLQWFEILAPYVSDPKAALLCTEALEARFPNGSKMGSATQAWRKNTWVTLKPRVLRDDWIGSYGFNMWVFGNNGLDRSVMKKNYVRFPAKEVAQIPLVGDCIWHQSICVTGDQVPTNLYVQDSKSEGGGGTSSYCMDRHKMAVNIAFLDGHAEHVPLAKLWRLKWSEDYQPSTVVIKG